MTSLDELRARLAADLRYERVEWPWIEYRDEPDDEGAFAVSPSADWVANAPGRVYVGADYVTVPALGLKYVHPSADYYPFTAGEMARGWLDWVLERAGRGRVEMGRLSSVAEVGPALFFDPPADRGGEWVMLDVKAAYWTLYSRVALDCLFGWVGGEIVYRPGQLAVPVEDRAWVAAEKPLRNAAWGLMLPGQLSWYEGGQYRSKPRSGGYVAHGVTQLVYATMNAIAANCRELGAVMWLTDAAICRPEQAPAIASHIESYWGLNVAVKASGPGHLYGLGDYRIGELQTAGEHVDRPGHCTLAPFTDDNIVALGRIGRD